MRLRTRAVCPLYGAVLLFNVAATPASAEPLTASVTLFESGVGTFDPETFGPDLLADVYHVAITNPNASDATSLQLALRGPWLNVYGSRSLLAEVALPTLLSIPVAETYFVYPGDAPSEPFAVGTVDTGQLLSASYTFSGDQALIEAGQTAVVAVLSVPAGVDPIPGLLPVFGRAVVNGVFECVGYPGDCFALMQHPEPSTLGLTLVLACFALATPGRRL